MSNERQRLWVPEISQDKFAPEPQFTPSEEIHLTLPKARMAGYFEVELIEAATGRIKEHYKFPNVITIHAFNAIGLTTSSVGVLIDNLAVGTGSTVPTPNDLKLEAAIDNTSNNGGFVDTIGYVTGSAHGPFLLGNPYHFIRKTRVFVESEANGALTELGFRDFNTPNVQFNRSLLRNNSGTPITINKTDQDQLKITYEARMYPPTYQTSGSFVLAIAETTHSWTASAQQITNTTAWGWQSNGFGLFARMGLDWSLIGNSLRAEQTASAPQNPTGSTTAWGWAGDNSGLPDVVSQVPYVCGSFTPKIVCNWDPASANFGPGGIQGFQMGWANVANYQAGVYFPTPIPKTSLDRLIMTYEVFFTASVTSSQ